MKNTTYWRDLTLTWLISIISLSLGMAISDIQTGHNAQRFLSSLFVFFIISVPFSLPAFIFFSVCGMMVLKKDIPVKKKKLKLILINYTDIFLTVFIMLGVFSRGEFNKKDLFMLVPLAILIVSSTIAIILLPFEKTNQNTQI